MGTHTLVPALAETCTGGSLIGILGQPGLFHCGNPKIRQISIGNYQRKTAFTPSDELVAYVAAETDLTYTVSSWGRKVRTSLRLNEEG